MAAHPMTQADIVYCDESCHIEHDHQPVMVLGGVWCRQEKAREIAVRLREIKQQHGLAANFEIKWGKVSPAKTDFYRAILDYFFDNHDLHFRAWVANKSNLRHAGFGQSQNDWYYKMMFGLLEPILSPDARYRIYFGQKDTRSARKVEKLHNVLCNSLYDFDRAIVERVQVIESHAVEQLQLSDLLLGALTYANRGLSANAGKNALIARIRERSHYSLTRPALLREQKFNLFIWQGEPAGVPI